MSNDLLALEQQLAELQAKVTAKRTEVRNAALEGIKAMLASGTLTAEDLRAILPKGPLAPRARDRKKPPKYRDPSTGETWTGQGATPNWLKDKNREDFLIVAVP
jgi:DNA-binding protein H-NS